MGISILYPHDSPQIRRENRNPNLAVTIVHSFPPSLVIHYQSQEPFPLGGNDRMDDSPLEQKSLKEFHYQLAAIILYFIINPPIIHSFSVSIVVPR